MPSANSKSHTVHRYVRRSGLESVSRHVMSKRHHSRLGQAYLVQDTNIACFYDSFSYDTMSATTKHQSNRYSITAWRYFINTTRSSALLLFFIVEARENFHGNFHRFHGSFHCSKEALSTSTEAHGRFHEISASTEAAEASVEAVEASTEASIKSF